MAGPLVAPLVALLLVGAAAVALRVQRSGQRRHLLRGASAPVPPAAADILYFTGKNCTVCHIAQRPAISRLREAITDLAVREIDVAADPQTARTYRVMTLPTTVVLDRLGRAVAVNAGFASDAVLRSQVEAARASGDAEVAVA
jgi:hypothetical protein